MEDSTLSFTSDLENERQAGRYKNRIIIGLFMLLLVMSIGWGMAPRFIDISIPPDLREGVTMEIGEKHPFNVWLFAQYLTQQIYTWDTNGAEDFPRRVYKFRNYLTPDYRQELNEFIQEQKGRGELKSRIRTFSPVPGSTYKSGDVQIDGNAWIVWLNIHVEDTMHGGAVKSFTQRYPVRVVLFDVDREANRFQLALDGNGGYEPMKIAIGALEK